MPATLTFDDEFNNLSLWNGSSGTWDTTFWYDDNNKGSTLPGNAEQEMYINANYAATSSVKPWTVSNGALNLTAAPASSAISSALGGFKYTSGMVNTYHSFAQEYGYFEMKAQLPAGQGLWPAFWLMPTDGSWPPELDIMEVLGNDPTKLYTTVHTAETGTHTMSSQGETVANMSTGMHTYGVDWEADKITFYFDGKEVYEVATPSDMHKPMYMIANLAVGGSWPGNADASTPFPATMKVDYIRAYNENPYTNGGAVSDGGSTTGSTGGSSTGGSTTGSTGSSTGGAASGSTGGTTGSTGSTGATGGSTTGSGAATAAQTLTATHPGSVLTGGSGADTLIASQGADTLTGGAGADHFVFKSEPWAPIHIADFKVGTDMLDISALLKADGYTGSDPVKDHYITLESDGNGGTLVGIEDHGQANINGHWPNRIIDLEHVSPTGLTWGQLTGTSTSGSTSGSTGGSATGSAGSTGGSTSGSTGGSTGGSTTGSTGSTGSTSGAAGHTLTATHSGSVLTGGSGADTLIASQGNDTLTGGAGADHFVFKSEPWAPIHVADFKVGTDVLDLSALLKADGYKGSDPVKDHYITLESDGHGGTLVGIEDHGQANIDGHWPNRIIDLEHVAPTGLTWGQLTGASSGTAVGSTGGSSSAAAPPATLPVEPTDPSTPSTGAGVAGQTLTANHVGSVLAGGAGADTLVSSQALDTMTGGAGADHFTVTANPWAPIHITDFQSGQDKIDLTALFKSTGYSGSDPVADHYMTVDSDGNGGSLIRFEANGQANINGHWPNTVIDLEHIAPSQVKSSDWIIH